MRISTVHPGLDLQRFLVLGNTRSCFNFFVLRAGAVLFNASCNEQVFSKSWKKIGANPSCRFREKRQKRTL